MTQVKKTCFFCDGTGMMCDVCGESEAVCRCYDATYHECDSCEGSGSVSVPQEDE